MLFKVVSPRILEALEEALNEVKDFLEVTLSQRLTVLHFTCGR